MSRPFAPLDEHLYMSLKTFRQNGEGVLTPVWFGQVDGRLYVTTRPESAKIKRIRQNAHVEVAPCTRTGELLGEFESATAQILPQDEVSRAVEALAPKYSETSLWQNVLNGQEDGSRLFLEISPA